MGLFDIFKKNKKEDNQRSKYLRRFELALAKCTSDEDLFKDIQLTFSRFEHLPETSSNTAKEIDAQIYSYIDKLMAAMETSKSEARAQAVHKILFNIDNLIQQRKALAKEFDESPKEDFKIEDGVVVEYLGNGGDIVVPSCVEAIGPRVFKDNQAIRSIVLQEGVKVIGEEAFYLCKALNYVKFPSTLAKIDQSAFYACKALDTVITSNGLITIDFYAFAKCSALKKFNIPRSLKTIKDKAFGGCDALPSDVKKQIKQLNKNAIKD